MYTALFFYLGISRLVTRARIFPGHSYFTPIEGQVIGYRVILLKANDPRSRS
jgi:hypothetical protein